MLLSMLACQWIFPLPAPTPISQPIPSLDELKFADPDTGQRFRVLDQCIRDLAGDGWRTTSYRLTGNFYTSSWCSGRGASPGCRASESSSDVRDQNVIELYTLFYPQDLPDVFGLGLHAYWVPESTGWGVSFFFSEYGDGIVGEGWGVTFREYQSSAGPPDSAVDLGRQYAYDIYETTVDHSPDVPLRNDLALYLASPEAMRDHGLEQIHALAEKVSQTIDAHQVITCDRGPYQGKGIPPACTPRPLKTDEETDELTRAEEHFADQEQLLRDHYQEMYSAWMKAFPLDRCWQ